MPLLEPGGKLEERGACCNRGINNNNNIAIWSGMTNAVLQVSGPL